MPDKSQILSQQNLYLSYLPHVRKQFGNVSGVEMIGLGAKEKSGDITDEWAFRFYVNKKRSIKEIPADEVIPATIFGIQTDVLSHFEKETLICDSSVLSVDSNSYRDQGIRGGIPIRNDHFDNDQPSGYGTLGVLARRKADNALVGLTCAHVVNAASQDLTQVNTKIGQPKYWITCCCCPHGYIGDVAKSTFNTDLDCAIIAIHDDIIEKVTTGNSEKKIEGLTTDITGAAAIVCFDTVTKRGRTTGLTTGRVSEIAYGTNQMLIERTSAAGAPFACHGDSGAVVVNSSGQVVGLVVAAARSDMKRTIVTHIKPVMAELGITIAGTDITTIGEPLGGGPTGCELLIWPGGQTETAMNPVEEFSSNDFGFTGAVNWDVSHGAAGAVIVQTGTQQATSLETISVRYDQASATKNATDTVHIQAIGTETVTKFRTVFKLTPRAINTSNPLDSLNTKRFATTGGTTNLAGVAVPVNAGDWFMAKAEIIYDIEPQNIAWSSGSSITFVTGAPAGVKGNIIARRQTKFTKGEQVNGTPNRVHTDQPAFALITAGSTADDFQAPTDTAPNNVFRLAGKGFDPSNLRQGYSRADYRDYLEFHNGTAWVQITSFTDWFANLTGGLNAAPPPTTGTPNTMEAGADTEKIPNEKPTVVPLESAKEVKPGEAVTMAVTVADPDNDAVTAQWAQTAGPAVVLSGTTGNSVTFTAPVTDPQLKFSIIGKDSTELLSRNAGNFQSDTAEIIINVVEWKNTGGGDPAVGRNLTEVFNAAAFGIGAGAMNWDVTTGGVPAVIIQADGAAVAATGTVNGATTIMVRYDTRSGDLTRAQTVKIQATNPANGKVWFKRRTVFRITVAVHATDTHTHLIPSTIPATGPDHFCTAQGQGDTLLQAVILPAPTPADINWQGTGAFVFTVPGTGADRATGRISSNTGTGQDIPFTVRIAGDICYNGRYWTIWTAVTQTITAIPAPGDPVTYHANFNSFSRSIRHTYTIQPATIISATPAVTDIPDLRGVNQNLAGNVVNPPDVTAADVNVANAGAGVLSGGADHKWDVSRQIRRRAVDVAHIPTAVAANAFFFTSFLNYPSNALAGNDDQGTADEDNDPYIAGLVAVGQICADDSPTRNIVHADGAVDDLFEVRNQFREFARILLDTTWYPISGFSTWRLHFLGRKRSEATDHIDYNGDGAQNQTFWVNNGTVIDGTNNGF